MKEFYKRVLISMVDVAKSGARVSARQHFAGTWTAIARDHLGKQPLHKAGVAGCQCSITQVGSREVLVGALCTKQKLGESTSVLQASAELAQC